MAPDQMVKSDEAEQLSGAYESASAVEETAATDPAYRSLDLRLRVLEALAEKWHASEFREIRASLVKPDDHS